MTNILFRLFLRFKQLRSLIRDVLSDTDNYMAGVFVDIKDREGRLLLVKHAYGRKLWSLPGGGMKHPQLPITCAFDEVEEETGVNVTFFPGREVIGMYAGRKRPSINFLFRAATYSNKPLRPKSEQEIAEIRFFAPHEIPWNALYPAQQRLTKRALDPSPELEIDYLTHPEKK